MKKAKSVVMFLLICLSCVMPMRVNADVIWEPEDAFYLTHSEDCHSHNRSYTANGPDGRVVIYKSPELNWKVETLENGKSVWISYTYDDAYGREWGYCDDGWLPMAYMTAVYDYRSFENDFGDEFIEKEVTLDASYNGQEVLFWSYPGSKWASDIPAEEGLIFDTVFVDEEGRTWGYSPYYYGHRNSWVCVDNPTADFETLYPQGGPERDTRNIKPYSGEDIVPKGNMILIVGIILCVVLVVISTMVVLNAMRKKK